MKVLRGIGFRGTQLVKTIVRQKHDLFDSLIVGDSIRISDNNEDIDIHLALYTDNPRVRKLYTRKRQMQSKIWTSSQHESGLALMMEENLWNMLFESLENILHYFLFQY